MQMNANQILQQIYSNSQAMQNPMIQNAMRMYQNHDSEGLRNMAQNLANERGFDIEQIKQNIRQRFGL